MKTLKDRMLVKVPDTVTIKNNFTVQITINDRNGIKMPMKSIQ